MKSKKRLLAFLLAVVMLLAACGGASNQSREPIYRGKISGGIYTNNSIQLSFALPEGWRFEDCQGLAVFSHVDVEKFPGEGADLRDFFDPIGRAPLIDMMAGVGSTTITVTIQDLSRTPGGITALVEAHIENIKRLMEMRYDQEHTILYIGEIAIGENAYYIVSMDVSMEIDSMQFEIELHRLFREQNGYAVIINFFTQSMPAETTITFDEIIAYFS